jgi:hypothetical protein
MSDDRCRACGAAVPTEAQWCSLCYADLREPAPVREPVSVPAAPSGADAAVPEPVAAAVAAGQPSNGLRPDADAILGLPLKSADLDDPQDAHDPAGAEEEVPEKTWPCTRCGEQVVMSLDACPACGSGFLAGASTPASMRLPVVGDIERLSRSQRLLAGLGVSLVVIVVLVVLATIGGHIF